MTQRKCARPLERPPKGKNGGTKHRKRAQHTQPSFEAFHISAGVPVWSSAKSGPSLFGGSNGLEVPLHVVAVAERDVFLLDHFLGQGGKIGVHLASLEFAR